MKKILLLCLISLQAFAGDLIFKNSFENKALISGTATGIASTGLILNLSVGSSNEPLTVNDNGTFIFFMEVDMGASYVVSIQSMPTAPSQSCTITNANGTVSSSLVNNIVVNCGASNNWDQMNWNSGIWN